MPWEKKEKGAELYSFVQKGQREGGKRSSSALEML